MRHIAITLVVVLIGSAFVALASGASNRDSNQSKYWVEMDSAFGLNAGGDMKVVGVRAGKITDIKLDRRTNRALVGFTIAQTGFGSLRSDVFCESRPQSLIGEYYLDCKPGNSPQVLRKTSPEHPIPVTQTASTISPDLVGDILRGPYRQRFSIILSELGAGVAGNGQNLNAAIQRAVPALRETDSVLAILARQNTVLANLATQGDAVLHDLSNNRADVQRFVVSAGNAARDSASRKANIEAGFARLPGFLAALQPAMVSLGNLAVSNTPALRNLNASARQLTRLFNNLGPFATVSTPAFASLGQASVTGDQAVKAATPTVQQLNTFAQGAPELAQNLSIILQHLNDPQFGAEHDPRAVAQHPQNGSNTYTGLESLLQYVFDQAGNTTYFDQNSHLLGLSTFLDPTTCSPYADAARAKAQPASCRAWLGPTQPGVTTPDPTQLVATPAAKVAANRTRQPVASLTPTNAPRSQTPAGAPSSGPSGAPGTSTSSPLRKATLAQLQTFSLNTDPLIRNLRPVARDLVPTLNDVRALAPDLRNTFVNLDPLITASQTGLPALRDLLNGTAPLLGALDPFLEQLNPILQFLEVYQLQTSQFISNGGSAVSALTTTQTPQEVGHYLRQYNPVGPESLSVFTQRDTNNRGNSYFGPNSFQGDLATKNLILPSYDCNNTGGEHPPVTGSSPAPGCTVDPSFSFQGALQKFPHIQPENYHP